MVRLFPRTVRRWPAVVLVTALLAAWFVADRARQRAHATVTGPCDGIAVGSAEEVVPDATRDRLGLDAWPDTAFGVLARGDDTYDFVAVGVPGLGPVKNVTLTRGTLDNPVALGVRAAGPVANVPPEVNYAGGGPVYRDPTSGLVLQVLHLERNWAVGRYYTELHLGIFDPVGGSSTRIGAIVQPDISFEQARAIDLPIDIGTSSLTRIGDHLYVYFPDAALAPDGRTPFTAVSVARAPLDEVLAAARRGEVTQWRKYHNGTWTESALGGASTDVQPGRSLAWHPTAARSRTLDATLMATGVSLREIVLSSSADGVTGWSTRHPLLRDPGSSNLYPTIVGLGADPAEPTDEFYVYYVQWPGSDMDWRNARVLRRLVTCTAGRPARTVPFLRYYNGLKHHVTTGAPEPGYRSESGWRLLDAKQPGTEALYGCRSGADDHFVSKDPECEGQSHAILRTEGWLYTARPVAKPSKALYRCYIPRLGGHFVSSDVNCESPPGSTSIIQEGLLGYAPV